MPSETTLPPLVMLGAGTFASMTRYCVEQETPWRVVAFAVDSAWVPGPVHDGLPVVPLESLHEHWPPDTVRLLAPMGPREANGLRRRCYEQAKRRGYAFESYVSPRASTWPDIEHGDNCLVYERAIIQPRSTIGSNVIIRSAAHVSHHCTIGSHAFIAPGAILAGNVVVGEQAFVGVGATVRDGVRIAPRSVVGAGAVLLADTEPDAVYVGNPARKAENPPPAAPRA